MSVPPSPSSSRGQTVLQPEYFTSNLFVDNLRRDIVSLIRLYRERYFQSSNHPFALFKRTWLSQRWQWLLFKVFDSRSRDTFLTVTLRLFLEKTIATEDPLTRTTALFGFYTFFYSQPKDTAPPLHAVSHVPIPMDHYGSLKELPASLTTPELEPLQPYAATVLSMLVNDGVFYILPCSSLSANNPRDLPREEVVDETAADVPLESGKRKRGRPSQHDKAKKSKAALDRLEKILGMPYGRLDDDPTRDQYLKRKGQMLDKVLSTEEGKSAVERASDGVLEGLRKAKGLIEGEGHSGLERAERAKAKGRLLDMLT
ncbi:hypothetical protein M378DRAFT_65532 [Amanita muscaria Koide BX008]|uniref:Uncharacterized protein n=1 Tax=Amanita muscaria (strain Koide BX008) TaxID=946122 RepID=A0A0C2TWE7_AMAMK|nr:hypothetical protein M378DRAFT_65532 [Amanita muscaria Koide BX008]